MSVCRPGSDQGGGKGSAPTALWKRPTLNIAISLFCNSLFSLLGFYAPSLHVGVFPLRSSSCHEFALLASLSCMSLCTSSHLFLTRKQFVLTFISRFCSQAALELSLGPQRAACLGRAIHRRRVTVNSVFVLPIFMYI